MESEQGKRVDEFDGEVAVAGGVHAVRCRAIKTQLRGHGLTIEGERGSGHGARSEWTKVGALAAVREAGGVAEKHFYVGQ